MKISKSSLPKQSILQNDKFNYLDSYEGNIKQIDKNLNSTDLGKAFFLSAPKWVGKLFDFRNKIVSVFGLKTPGKITDKNKLLDNFKCEVGDQLGLFKVFSKTENEVILGEDDKHLNFRISLFLKQENLNYKIIITTTVKFNNWFGRLYFIPVKPFHKIIVPSMLKGIIKELKN